MIFSTVSIVAHIHINTHISRLFDENYHRVAFRSSEWKRRMVRRSDMIYGRAKRTDAFVDIDPVNEYPRFYPTNSCKLAGAVKMASGRARCAWHKIKHRIETDQTYTKAISCHLSKIHKTFHEFFEPASAEKKLLKIIFPKKQERFN